MFFHSCVLLCLCYTLTLRSRPIQNPPSTVMFKPFLVIFIGMGVLETTVRLKRDSSCTNATLDSMSANRLPGTEWEAIINWTVCCDMFRDTVAWCWVWTLKTQWLLYVLFMFCLKVHKHCIFSIQCIPCCTIYRIKQHLIVWPCSGRTVSLLWGRKWFIKYYSAWLKASLI